MKALGITLILLVCLPFLFSEVVGQQLYSPNGESNFALDTSQIDSSECVKLQKKMLGIAQGTNYQMQYDSAKYCIEHCYSYSLYPPVRVDFGASTSGCQYMNSDRNRFSVYRSWLKSVLYLDKDSFYYCSDVNAILFTFNWFNDERGHDINGELAVLKFLRDSNICQGIIPDQWDYLRNEQYNIWIDSVFDPHHIPKVDSTLPTLEDLDLQILRGPQYAAVKDAFTPSTTKKILYLSASENPFTDETTLHFGLSDKEYMKLEVFDLLGNVVYSSGGLFTEGDGSLRIMGKGIPRGQLYARLSTMGREVMTIKLVKE